MNSEPKSFKPTVSPLCGLNSGQAGIKIRPAWVAASIMLASLGISNVGASPVARNPVKNKTSHAQPAAQGTRLFATGAVDPETSTLKAITSDNRFTWIHLPADVLIVQGGKNIIVDAVGEGDKLLCQGKWIDDAWGPVFQAKRVEILGNVGGGSLQEKIAAACQAVQGTSRPASSPDDDPITHKTGSSREADDAESLAAYVDASCDRSDAADRAFTEMDHLADAADSNPAARHNPQAVGAIKDAVAKYKQALDLAHSLAPVPLVLRSEEEYERQRDQQMKLYADLRLQYFGVSSDHGLHLMGQVLRNAHRLNDKAQAALAHDREEFGF